MSNTTTQDRYQILDNGTDNYSLLDTRTYRLLEGPTGIHMIYRDAYDLRLEYLGR